MSKIKDRYCIECGAPITKGSKSGKCKRCGHKKESLEKIEKNLLPKFCSKCGKEISRRSVTGKCRLCRGREIRAYHTKSPYPRGKRRAICFRCKRPYKAQRNQHPKYSLCPSCKAFSKEITPGLLWSGRGNI